MITDRGGREDRERQRERWGKVKERVGMKEREGVKNVEAHNLF